MTRIARAAGGLLATLAGLAGCGGGGADIAAVDRVMKRAVPLEASCTFAAAPNGRDDLVALVTSNDAKDKLTRSLSEADLDARVVVGEDNAARETIERSIRAEGPRPGNGLGWSIRRTAPSDVDRGNQQPHCGLTVVTIKGTVEPTSEYVEFEKMLRRDYRGSVKVVNEIIILQ